MSKKEISPESYKKYAKVCKVLFVICLVIGIPTFLFGGFLFVIGGLFFLILSKGYSQKANTPVTSKQTTKKQTTKKQGLEYGLNYVYVNKNSKVYHDDIHCRSVKPDFDMITWENAVDKGLTRCKFCHK